jgi:hypothetical protein
MRIHATCSSGILNSHMQKRIHISHMVCARFPILGTCMNGLGLHRCACLVMVTHMTMKLVEDIQGVYRPCSDSIDQTYMITP